MIKMIKFVLFLLLVFSGCKDENSAAETAAVVQPDPVLSVPGTILLPGADGFFEMNESDHDAILLYCWLPLGEYAANENDLLFLATVQDRGITAVPVQFTTAVRNASQSQLNELGISISVALGDEELKDFLVADHLPVASLVHSDGTVVSAYGFGCVERTLRGTQ